MGTLEYAVLMFILSDYGIEGFYLDVPDNKLDVYPMSLRREDRLYPGPLNNRIANTLSTHLYRGWTYIGLRTLPDEAPSDNTNMNYTFEALIITQD